MPTAAPETYRFGQFELDPAAGELRRDGRRRRLQAQPFKLLVLLARRAGTLVTYDDIRAELWGEGTFVEFDQAVHFAVRQIRDALGDSAEQSLYIETVPKRGYRFVAPVEPPKEAPAPAPAPTPVFGTRTTVRLQKALWANIAELREAEAHNRRMRQGLILVIVMLASIIVYVVAMR